MSQNAINPTRAQNYPEWYQEVIKAADLAEVSPVRGCSVIKPWGYAMWEHMQAALDKMIKDTGHVNASFPLLIPLSFMAQEAKHVEGFAKECAVVTHHRLKTSPEGKLIPDPTSELEEAFIIRPTSETIIGHMYAKWVQSYRDLPILMNQWCNVFRWEMRTRLFLRTAEFHWQEGHTVHASAPEAVEETLKMLDVYESFAHDFMAMPVIKGMKTPDERFPGAVDTYTIEAMTQDKKAVQAGTSHFLGQNFAEASGIKFQNKDGGRETAWTTSWGVSTRLIGALIMAHSDDDGLVLPPRLAPAQVILIPVYKDETERTQVLGEISKLKAELEQQLYNGQPVRVKVDDRDLRAGDRGWQAIKQGVPVRVELGPRDLLKGEVFVGRRDHAPKAKRSLARGDFIKTISETLEAIQRGLFERALAFREAHTHEFHDLKSFEAFFASSADQEGAPGFALVPWHEAAMDHEILGRLKITPRCQPLGDPGPQGAACIFSGKPATHRVIFAKSY